LTQCLLAYTTELFRTFLEEVISNAREHSTGASVRYPESTSVSGAARWRWSEVWAAPRMYLSRSLLRRMHVPTRRRAGLRKERSSTSVLAAVTLQAGRYSRKASQRAGGNSGRSL